MKEITSYPSLPRVARLGAIRKTVATPRPALVDLSRAPVHRGPPGNAVDLNNKTELRAQIGSRWCVEAPPNPLVPRLVLRYRRVSKHERGQHHRAMKSSALHVRPSIPQGERDFHIKHAGMTCMHSPQANRRHSQILKLTPMGFRRNGGPNSDAHL